MQKSEKFQVSTSKVGEFYGYWLSCYQIITGGTHYLLSAYQLYSVNSMFIIDINKTKSILYLVFLRYSLLALPLSLAIFML